MDPWKINPDWYGPRNREFTKREKLVDFVADVFTAIVKAADEFDRESKALNKRRKGGQYVRLVALYTRLRQIEEVDVPEVVAELVAEYEQDPHPSFPLEHMAQWQVQLKAAHRVCDNWLDGLDDNVAGYEEVLEFCEGLAVAVAILEDGIESEMNP